MQYAMNVAEYFTPLLSPHFVSIFTYSLLISATILNAALLMLIIVIWFNQKSVTPFKKRNYKHDGKIRDVHPKHWWCSSLLTPSECAWQTQKGSKIYIKQ